MLWLHVVKSNMRNVTATVKSILKLAHVLDNQGLNAYADVLHGVLKRKANDEFFMFGEGDEAYPEDDGWIPPPDDEPRPSMEELERADFERELFDLMMKREYSRGEGLTQEELERMQQLMHYLKGNSWDSYTGDPDAQRLKKVLKDPILESIG